jgi:aspartyl-tRNA(Asn)/glutamyl-tRNA(Gln) amidotransferase subunit A
MLNQLTIAELTAKIARREVSAREATQACLDQVSRVDGRIHAFLSHDANDALAQADAVDKAVAAGATLAERLLLGVPVGIKDVLAVRNQPLNCGSKILGRFVSPYDATVIEKLRAAGAIIFGRLNMDEFAMGSSTENSAFGATRNPWDTSRGFRAARPAARRRRSRPASASQPWEATPAAPSDSPRRCAGAWD